MANRERDRYLTELEAFRRFETRRQFFMDVVGMSADLARIATNAEANHNDELLRECFDKLREPAPEKAPEEKKIDPFLKGFQEGGQW